MPFHDRAIWNDESIYNVSTCATNTQDKNHICVEKPFRWDYEGALVKAELFFLFDVSSFAGCILDELKPIVINGERVPLSLPSEKIKLKYVEIPSGNDKAGVDVTRFIRAKVPNDTNTIQVNYLVRETPILFGKLRKKNVGKLRLVLRIRWSGEGDNNGDGGQIAVQKFCMWHGEPIDSSASYCPFKGGEKFESTITPQTTKLCPNPSCPGKKIHIREIYCEYCGVKQPGM